jgi:hypothetical protein
MRFLVLLIAALSAPQAHAHDIYTFLTGKDGYPCCGGESKGALRDCWRTIYRERGANFEFRLQNGDWVNVPIDRIQFVPIPGDVEDGGSHRAHLCYQDAPAQVADHLAHSYIDRTLKTVGGIQIVLFCAVIPPGGL